MEGGAADPESEMDKLGVVGERLARTVFLAGVPVPCRERELRALCEKAAGYIPPASIAAKGAKQSNGKGKAKDTGKGKGNRDGKEQKGKGDAVEENDEGDKEGAAEKQDATGAAQSPVESVRFRSVPVRAVAIKSGSDEAAMRKAAAQLGVYRTAAQGRGTTGKAGS